MSFRARLITFFVVIVVVPMVAMAVLMFRLISDSEQGKANARVDGLAAAAGSLYQNEAAVARRDAETVAHAIGRLRGERLKARFTALVGQAGFARARLSADGRTLVDVGDRTAVAPGTAIVTDRAGRRRVIVEVSELTASQYARDLAAPEAAVAVRQGARALGSSLPVANRARLPANGNVTLAGVGYRAVAREFAGFAPAGVTVTVMSALSSTASSLGTSYLVAAAFIAAFLLLALAFAILASRALQERLSGFLHAARRLGSGDFSSPIEVEGGDEFAALGQEFNHMSNQLARRLEELTQERVRLRESIRRIGQTFASSLDQPTLLELALRTAVDAVHASGGRLTIGSPLNGSLTEAERVGSLAGLDEAVRDSEQAAFSNGGLGEAALGKTNVLSATLGYLEPGNPAHGVITVARPDRAFTDDDREVLRSLGVEAALALENIELHNQVQRQAVTDELTGLANHGRFQELLDAELEQVRRYHHPIGLIMLDIDDFKAVNDSYGHPQGDAVLRQVAQVLRANSRDADTPARYGGEELALILPHTDLEGAFAIAERIRAAVQGLRVARTDGSGPLRITASLGVAASTDGHKDALIGDSDAALYEAKRKGKNRTMKAAAQAADVSGAG